MAGMAHSFLLSCRPEEAAHNVKLHSEDRGLDHWASEQFRRLHAGDELWIVTQDSGEVYLVGHLVAEEVLTAKKMASLKRPDLWAASYHALCDPEQAELMGYVLLSPLLANLRFISKRDRLAFRKDGSLKPQQMRTMRRLTPESARKLNTLWYGEEEVLPTEPCDADGFGFQQDLELRRATEQAAVSQVTALLTAEGWHIVSVEADCCGYDLHCERAGKELHVEVKGTTANVPGFIMTRSEFARARTDAQFLLCVVTDVLTKFPSVHRFNSEEMSKAFDLEAIQYRATLKV